MLKIAKKFTKNLFRTCGLEIRRIQQFEPYGWLKRMNIRTVFDIGANTGQFASQIQRVLPDAILYSFEPIEDCYIELLKRMNRVPNFHAFNFALGDTNGQSQIYRNNYTQSSSLLPMMELHKQAFPFTAHTNIRQIEIRRLNDFSKELNIVDNVMIKIDVQGTEDKVILGGGALLRRATVLIVETSFEVLYKDQPLFGDVYDLLRERGFVHMGTEDIMRDPRDGRVLQCDSIFCRRNQ